MEAHLKGRPHLAQLQRLRDKEVRDRTGGRSHYEYLGQETKVKYDENYWDQNRGRNRKLRPEHERFLDWERLENTLAKFDPRDYDNGLFKFDSKENYCSKCDIWTKSRDQMLIHKEGANYKKMSAKVQRYRCDMCLIDVPSQEWSLLVTCCCCCCGGKISPGSGRSKMSNNWGFDEISVSFWGFFQ